MSRSPSHLEQPVRRLHQLRVCSRWSFVAACWSSLGAFGIWGLRQEIALWQQHLTWAAVRYGLAYNLLPASCLFFCIGIAAAVLVWQSQYVLRDISRQERQRLEQQIRKIEASGPRHPLWKWVFPDADLRGKASTAVGKSREKRQKAKG